MAPKLLESLFPRKFGQISHVVKFSKLSFVMGLSTERTGSHPSLPLTPTTRNIVLATPPIFLETCIPQPDRDIKNNYLLLNLTKLYLFGSCLSRKRGEKVEISTCFVSIRILVG